LKFRVFTLSGHPPGHSSEPSVTGSIPAECNNR